MKQQFFILAVAMLIAFIQGQAQVAVNTNGAAPHPSAILDVQSTSKGLRIPLMSSSERLAITPLTDGLIVYQTDGTEGLYYCNGSVWNQLRYGTLGNLWEDGGSYLFPVGAGSGAVKIADNPLYQFGLWATMNTGNSNGYGGYLSHTNTSQSGTGLYVEAHFNGSNNLGITRGIEISTSSTTQDQYGIYSNHTHTGNTGVLTGLYNYSGLSSGNPQILYGMHQITTREGSENINYGIRSVSSGGSEVFGVYGFSNLGTNNHGLYGYANGGTLAYGVYGWATGAATNYGVYGTSSGWGGFFDNGTSGFAVKLGGASYAMQLTDGTQGAGKVLTSDASGNASWQTPVSKNPGGSDGSVQYKSGTSFAGASDFFWDNANKRLGIGTSAPFHAIEVNGDINLMGSDDAYGIGGFDILHAKGGNHNLIVGKLAGNIVDNTNQSTFVGAYSGYYDTASMCCTFIGYESGYNSRKGFFNTYLGAYAGNTNTTGELNTFLGYSAGTSSEISSRNTFIGANAGNDNTYGNDNTFLGYNAGYNNTQGGTNTFIGSEAGYNSMIQVGNVFIGYKAGYSENGNYKLIIHNNEDANPLVYGEFNNRILKFNGRLGVTVSPNSMASLTVNQSDDNYCGYFTSNYNSSNTKIVYALYTGTVTQDAIAVFGQSTPVANTNYGIGGEFTGNYIGVRASSNAGTSTGSSYGLHSVCDGNGGFRYGLYSEARGGTSRYGVYAKANAQYSNSYGVYCDGNGVYTGTWSNISDLKLKDNIEGIANALDLVMMLKPSSYNFRVADYKNYNLVPGTHYGFIAQDIEKVIPGLVGSASLQAIDDKNPDAEEFKTINYIEITGLKQALRHF